MKATIHPIRHTADGVALCRWCSKATSHYTLFVCAERIRYRVCLVSEREHFDRKFLSDCGIAVDDAPARVTVEIVMQGAVVRKAREAHALRHRKPLMGERRASECGEIYLGDLS
jgi:hypothetical protein